MKLYEILLKVRNKIKQIGVWIMVTPALETLLLLSS